MSDEDLDVFGVFEERSRPARRIYLGHPRFEIYPAPAQGRTMFTLNIKQKMGVDDECQAVEVDRFWGRYPTALEALEAATLWLSNVIIL